MGLILAITLLFSVDTTKPAPGAPGSPEWIRAGSPHWTGTGEAIPVTVDDAGKWHPDPAWHSITYLPPPPLTRETVLSLMQKTPIEQLASQLLLSDQGECIRLKNASAIIAKHMPDRRYGPSKEKPVRRLRWYWDFPYSDIEDLLLDDKEPV